MAAAAPGNHSSARGATPAPQTCWNSGFTTIAALLSQCCRCAQRTCYAAQQHVGACLAVKHIKARAQREVDQVQVAALG